MLKLQRAFKNELQDINNSDISILSTKLNKRNIRDQNSSNSFVRKYFAPTPSKRIVSNLIYLIEQICRIQ